MAITNAAHLRFSLAWTYQRHSSSNHAETSETQTTLRSVLVLTRAWADAWSTAATDSEVLDSMSSKTSSMFS